RDRQLLSGSGDGSLCIWAMPDGNRVARIKGAWGAVRCGALMPGNKSAVFGSNDGHVRVWEPSQAKARILGQHEGVVLCCAASANGQWLLTGGNDKLIKIWNMGEPRLGCEYFVGAPVTCISWMPEGSVFIAGDEQGRIHI